MYHFKLKNFLKYKTSHTHHKQHVFLSQIKPCLSCCCNTFFYSNLTTSSWAVYAEDIVLESNQPGHSSDHSYSLHTTCCRDN